MTFEASDLRIASLLTLTGGAVLPLLPGEPGLPCPLRTLTGIPCPLCGMTTSVEETLRLDVADAFAANPGGVAVVAAALALLVVRPRKLSVPTPLASLAFISLWLFELDRFSIV